MMKKKLSYIAVVSIPIGMGMLTSCSVNDNPGKEVVFQKADLVVYRIVSFCAYFCSQKALHYVRPDSGRYAY